MKAQRNAQDNIRRELDAMPLPDSPLTEEQKRRILARACEKAGLKAPAAPGAGRSLRARGGAGPGGGSNAAGFAAGAGRCAPCWWRRPWSAWAP